MNAVCSVAECAQRVHAKHLCKVHYARRRRHGSTDKRPHPRGGPAQEFIARALAGSDDDECLFWPYSRSNQGYAMATISGRVRSVHRYICEITNGDPVGEANQAAHSCGNGKLGCIAKAHLSWKTRHENERDKQIHGSIIRGEYHHSAKLSSGQVQQIMALKGKLTIRQIAPMFGVSATSISRVHRGERI